MHKFCMVNNPFLAIHFKLQGQGLFKICQITLCDARGLDNPPPPLAAMRWM